MTLSSVNVALEVVCRGEMCGSDALQTHTRKFYTRGKQTEQK